MGRRTADKSSPIWCKKNEKNKDVNESGCSQKEGCYWNNFFQMCCSSSEESKELEFNSE